MDLAVQLVDLDAIAAFFRQDDPQALPALHSMRDFVVYRLGIARFARFCLQSVFQMIYCDVQFIKNEKNIQKMQKIPLIAKNNA